VNISVHICFTLATGCAYALYIYMYVSYMYVYIYMYACIYIHICIYLYTCICVYVWMYIYVYVCVYVYVYICICMGIYIYIYLSVSYACAVRFIFDGGVELVCESACSLAWVVIFDRRKDRGVVCVFSIFNAGGSVCGCVCVYTHTNTHTTQMGYLDVSPGVGMRHLEGPKNPDGLNLVIHIFVYVYKVHMCIYAKRRDEILD